MPLNRIYSPTLADVAREARVSLMTASRVLNGARNVRQAKIIEVRAAMARLGYRPNELARSLISRKTSSIGMIIANLSNPFVVDVIKEIQSVARSNEYVVTITSSGSSADIEKSEIETLVRRRIDGLVIAPAESRRDTFSDVLPESLPVVIFDQLVCGTRFDSVTITNRRSAHEATQHLLGHGLRRIVAVGTRPYLYTSKERVAGYREAMNGASLEARSCLVGDESVLTPKWISDNIFKLHKADGIFTLNWVSTLHVLRGLRELRVRVGRDVPLISFDDFNLGDVLSPTLTVVKQPSETVGRESAKLLFERLNGEVDKQPRRVVLPASLLIRESCGCSV